MKITVNTGGLLDEYLPPGTSGQSFSRWSTVIPGNDIAISGPEDLDIAINLAKSLYSFGFDFHEPTDNSAPPDGCNTPSAACVVSTFIIAFLNGAAIVDGTTVKEYFGELNGGTRPVPAPATSLLLVIGITVIGLSRRRCLPVSKVFHHHPGDTN